MRGVFSAISGQDIKKTLSLLTMSFPPKNSSSWQISLKICVSRLFPYQAASPSWEKTCFDLCVPSKRRRYGWMLRPTAPCSMRWIEKQSLRPIWTASLFQLMGQKRFTQDSERGCPSRKLTLTWRSWPHSVKRLATESLAWTWPQ